ncbi:hypothetical protein NQ318_022598 [Aromia moschata]|uniref:PiggyBac transposable element-derived protein domain-containing protein n=1 Tax=Aromia moschata TaxID=1265417 RepID=A0AAV8XVA2_9CUCU|nr:hypothetical protein NQ318_022598 [Aromia moschata]
MLIPFRGRCAFHMYIPNKPTKYDMLPIQDSLHGRYRPSFSQTEGEQSSRQFFGFTSTNTIVSYVPKKGKSVILVSSMHHSATIDNNNKKPEIIMMYNDTESGVDALIAKCALYSTSRRTNRWPMAIFHAILNIADVNSRVIYQFALNRKIIRRFEFLRELGIQLIEEHMRLRMSNNKVPLNIRNMAGDILGIPVPILDVPIEPIHKSKRKRCAI